MSNLKLQLPKDNTYAAWWDHAGEHGKVIGYNTQAVRIGDGVAIYHHTTAIVIYNADGTITLNTNGWETKTTKFRMNLVLPDEYRVSQADWQWWISGEKYYDGMVLPRIDRTLIDVMEGEE